MRITGILFAVVLAGCAATPDLASWQGASRDEVVLTYGVPTAETQLSDGKSLIEYHRKPFGDDRMWYCTTRFILDTDGRVTSGALDGNTGCEVISRTAL